MGRSMSGVLFPGSNTCVLEAFDVPKPGNGEVPIEMHASGLCGSDLEYLSKRRRP